MLYMYNYTILCVCVCVSHVGVRTIRYQFSKQRHSDLIHQPAADYTYLIPSL